ncbi:histidine triad family protein (homolog to bis(5'-nucleosyl)-tetraphosphatase) [Natronomonas pharaonis DSM 2160]|uniref:Histidine triad family protein (Homolog to bis(5'-nucleosyl)-tetraphosphatase) n=1 Tax=Natronomonas pharaonis (strain ATCC 35678 / DSM 2160 / CIP 103997 / JCM 8858 / NBRC 14720 / NCIMB 2260 / Gabara) TaxID=348780 RepID=A0A1U7EX38_NATPD|nr:HIT domain-containing protein [Natronomonas pharaonis]CAI49688.1 histidine triad family protein (homolog to bis(5'-nucleosyl)-tetraphosphatase) [Natronomonas pharaonis DSM 2160]
MDQVFAPWRIKWVEREDKNEAIDGCPFCVLPERDDASESLVVAESEHAFVLLNNYPYNPGHAMVIPRPHVGEYPELEPDVLFDHARLKQRTIEALNAAFEPDGINAGLNLGEASGGSIDDHLHTHLVPRWHGDTNFMPVCSDTKVIVQAVEETHEQLMEAFAAQPDTEPLDSGAVFVDI